MSRTLSGRILASLRAVSVAVVLAAAIAGYATNPAGADAAPAQLDLAVVSTAN